MKTLMICISLLLLALPSAAKRTPASWQLTDRYEKKADTEVMRSVIEFRKGSAVSTYKPEEMPFGLVLKERALINKQEYFITGWAHGAKTVMFRIFSPETEGVKPLCEEVSFGEETSLRQQDDKIQVQIFSPSGEEIWKDCK